MKMSRDFNQRIEGTVTKVFREIAADEAKRNKAKKTRKVPGFKFPKRNRHFVMPSK